MPHPITRRQFAAASLAVPAFAQNNAAAPWYRTTLRWGQTNITELDPTRYDIPWWRDFWKRTAVQGVILNAGGIVAYYPSKFPLHHRAEFLGNRDLYGELAQAAHSDGLVVLARMDSNRTADDFFRAHPDWFARDANGQPYRAADKYVTCVNSAYYDDYIPEVMREIIERSHPEGLTDNSWSGLGRDSICYCDNCARKFRDSAASALPRKHDWSDPVYRRWIEWNYARRLAIWDLNNRVTKGAGGPDCLWIGMNSGSISSQSRSFRDCKALWERAEILMLDHQARGAGGFEENTDTGKLIHGIMGWDKLIPESMAMYNAGGRVSFRMAAKPASEARMWMLEGLAGGIQPWWHHIAAYHEDRRMYRTAEPIMRFHQHNERYLVGRQPVASVGLVWSQRNTDFYGRDNAAELTDLPYRGWAEAMLRARIPYVPVHIDHVEREASHLRALILPDLAVMTEDQCRALRAFVFQGGSVIATGLTSLLDENGDTRPDFALAALFGVHAPATRPNAQAVHTYLRLAPELRASVPGPHAGDEPKVAGKRHPVLEGFDETDLLAFGGVLAPMHVDAGVEVPLTFVPEFPVFPPETSWMRQPRTDIPGLALRGRTAFLPADLDRRYARDGMIDHGDLLANLVRWAAGDSIPLKVEGPGRIDCQLYSQGDRLLLHLVNLTSAGTGRAPIDDNIPVGPLAVRIRVPRGFHRAQAQLRVSGKDAPARLENGWIHFNVPVIRDHEFVIL